MKKSFLLLLIVLFCLLSPAWAGSYQYISSADTRDNLNNKVPMALIDIQVEEEFNQHHLPNALATYAYPVKSDADKSRIDAFLPQLKESSEIVVVVCPRGGGGAKRAYDHLEKQGIASERLFILEKGQQGWPYPELLAQK
ncbi:Rhodanese-like domain-containing protein [Malonomonas rubra DSM 5091]|uniref:Rhodanese-like domain-containing protein n=1 Tax=Malonomonas rubra DSM 5091 TaxID=1122189 RepID=A0A1M6JIF9_MALRU|nr:rhodanese-like domain-containing protein [Malonomonas rubra]SHJ46435.1 Rhodanese-like domain-containing protein [Malonomonas rubra DSM 5091]